MISLVDIRKCITDSGRSKRSIGVVSIPLWNSEI